LLLCTSQIHLSICNHHHYNHHHYNQHHHHHHHHHHRRRRNPHKANLQLGHLLTRSGLTLPEVSVTISPGSICLLVWSILLSSAICHKPFCLHVATNSFCIPVFCPKLRFYLVPLQSVCLFYDLSKCILLLISYISSLLLLFFLHLLLYGPTFTKI